MGDLCDPTPQGILDLAIDLHATPTYAWPGAAVHYVFEFGNQSALFTGTNVVVTGVVPSLLENVMVAGTITFSQTRPVMGLTSSALENAHTTYVWTVQQDLAPGEFGVFTLTGAIPVGFTGTGSYTATAAIRGVATNGQSDAALANNAAWINIQIGPAIGVGGYTRFAEARPPGVGIIGMGLALLATAGVLLGRKKKR